MARGNNILKQTKICNIINPFFEGKSGVFNCNVLRRSLFRIRWAENTGIMAFSFYRLGSPEICWTSLLIKLYQYYNIDLHDAFGDSHVAVLQGCHLLLPTAIILEGIDNMHRMRSARHRDHAAHLGSTVIPLYHITVKKHIKALKTYKVYSTGIKFLLVLF